MVVFFICGAQHNRASMVMLHEEHRMFSEIHEYTTDQEWIDQPCQELSHKCHEFFTWQTEER